MEASTATTAETPPEPVEGATAPENAPESTSEGSAPETRERDESGRLLSREAARYRTQLREAEAERDSLREQLDRHQRTEVERLATQQGLAVASDIWQFGATLDTLRGEDGSIDGEVVTGLVGDILKSRPGLSAPRNGNLGGGLGGTAGMTPKVGLSQLLKPGAR